jgi:hypothetical protein
VFILTYLIIGELTGFPGALLGLWLCDVLWPGPMALALRWPVLIPIALSVASHGAAFGVAFAGRKDRWAGVYAGLLIAYAVTWWVVGVVAGG